MHVALFLSGLPSSYDHAAQLLWARGIQPPSSIYCINTSFVVLIPSDRSTISTTTSCSFACSFNHGGRESEKGSRGLLSRDSSHGGHGFGMILANVVEGRVKANGLMVVCLDIALSTMETIILLESRIVVIIY